MTSILCLGKIRLHFNATDLMAKKILLWSQITTFREKNIPSVLWREEVCKYGEKYRSQTNSIRFFFFGSSKRKICLLFPFLVNCGDFRDWLNICPLKIFVRFTLSTVVSAINAGLELKFCKIPTFKISNGKST